MRSQRINKQESNTNANYARVVRSRIRNANNPQMVYDTYNPWIGGCNGYTDTTANGICH